MLSPFKKLVSLVIKEAIFWLILPSLFVAFYIVKYGFDLQSGVTHIEIITFCSLAIIFFKILLFQSLKSNRDAVFLASIMYGVFFYLLIIYYALVVISLASWGKVITSELLISYIISAKQFLLSIEISFTLVIALLIVSFILITTLCYVVLRRFFIIDYPLKRPTNINEKLVSVLIFILFLLSYHVLITRILSPDLSSHEPINLTLYSGKNFLDSRFYPRSIPYNRDYNINEESAKSEYKPNQEAKKKNIILIFVDALRLKNLQVYGYNRKTTPYLNHLYETGQLKAVKQAYASCPETSCALSSFLASRYPHQLPKDPFTFVDVLKKHGYKTVMILGGDHTNFYGIRDLYGDVNEYYDGSMEKKYFFNDDALITNKATDLPIWDKQPTFLQFHLMSAHTLGKHHEEFKRFTPSKSYAALKQGPINLSYINHYDNGVLQADTYIKELLHILEEKKYLEDSVVIITADHGELLGEHGFYTHANNVWEELLHIPLLVINQNNQHIVNLPDDKLVSQVDVAPEILNALNMPVPKSWAGGRLKTKLTDNYIYFRWPPRSGLYDQSTAGETWKYWQNYNTGEEYIFNISQDPKEENNLVWDSKLQAKKKIWRDTISKDRLINPTQQKARH